MPYDFTAAAAALRRAGSVDGWADKKSAQLQRDYLVPMQDCTLRLESLAEEIAAFIFDVERNISEIND